MPSSTKREYGGINLVVSVVIISALYVKTGGYSRSILCVILAQMSTIIFAQMLKLFYARPLAFADKHYSLYQQFVAVYQAVELVL
jgi:hypothetical protein